MNPNGGYWKVACSSQFNCKSIASRWSGPTDGATSGLKFWIAYVAKPGKARLWGLFLKWALIRHQGHHKYNTWFNIFVTYMNLQFQFTHVAHSSQISSPNARVDITAIVRIWWSYLSSTPRKVQDALKTNILRCSQSIALVFVHVNIVLILLQ